jgi:hypothetical protein
LDLKGEQHSLAGEGVGGPNSDDWKERPSLLIYSVVVEIVSWQAMETSVLLDTVDFDTFRLSATAITKIKAIVGTRTIRKLCL